MSAGRSRSCSPPIPRSRAISRSRSWIAASTTRRSCATSPTSSPASTRWRRPSVSPVSHGVAAFVRSGKVRDLYALGDDRLLLVASDRISAFDVVLPTAIPDKGRVLTGLSRYWFGQTAGILPNHLLGTHVADVPPDVVAE